MSEVVNAGIGAIPREPDWDLANRRIGRSIGPSVMVIESIAADQTLEDLKIRLSRREGVVNVSGLWGSSAPMVTALTCRGSGRTVVYVTAHIEQADDARDDLELFLGHRCDLFPAWEALPGEGAASGEIGAERLRLCHTLLDPPKILSGNAECRVVVTPVQALMQSVPPPDVLGLNTISFRVGSPIVGLSESSPEALTAWAVDRGYERLDLVESPGDIAQRGDIVDLFILGDDNPVRVQFFDDQIESIRRIDISTQRSIETLTTVGVVAMPVQPTSDVIPAAGLFDYLPDDALIVLDGPGEIQEMGETLRVRLGPDDSMFDVKDVLAAAYRFPQMQLQAFVATGVADEATYSFDVSSVARFTGSASDAVSELCHVATDHEVHVLCDNEGERQRLREMILEKAPDQIRSIRLEVAAMHRGFEWCATRTVVVPHHEVFHRLRQKRRVRKMYAGRAIESWLDLKPGDEVLVPSATFWASVVPMLWVGAVPVFCESESERLGLDPGDVERKITPRTKAMVVVHLWGMPSRMTELVAIARRHDLRIIEDASHAQGATWRGRKCGTLGDIAVFSLQSSKLAPAGEGGILLTDSDEYFERAVCMGDITRIIELDLPARRFAATSFGIKTRMAPLSAAVARVQLRHFAERNARRSENLRYLSNGLEPLGFHTFLPPPHIER
ncbi:MAG: DegT/DnrJ/EryC1/StrS family aminotransferase, partial [Planctomycetes bacterium]|nr:DegT/DnrJ/EryC1/StrS family aminotransferase [Planctomycetota bacterium]